MAQAQQEKQYTWDDLAAAIGQDFSGGASHTGVDPIEKSQIRRFLEPLEMDCPLFFSDEVARQHGYQGVFAPYSSLTAPFGRSAIWMPGDTTRFPSIDPDDIARYREHKEPGPTPPPLPMPKTTAFFVTDVEVEYFGEAYVGDRLTTQGRKLLSVAVKRTSVGYGAFVTWETEVINQKGEIVAKQRSGGYFYNPHPTDDQAG